MYCLSILCIVYIYVTCYYVSLYGLFVRVEADMCYKLSLLIRQIVDDM